MLSDNDEAAGTPRKKMPDDHRLVLNVGGVRHETHVSTLKNFQNTRLSRLAENHLSSMETNEYFFDRHPAVFNSVIDFYRSGELHVPLDVCGAVVKRELDYWQIDEYLTKACCWRHYRSYIDNQRILDSFNLSLLEEQVNVNLDHLRGWKKVQMTIWLILDHPRTSRTAMVYGITSFTFVMVSILGFTLETIPAFSVKPHLNVSCNGNPQKALLRYMTPQNALNILDIICTVFFSLELIARFIFSPNKLLFVRSPMNIIDLLALVPLYFQMTIAATKTEHCYLNEKLLIEIMFILRIIRMFRIFHLVKHYQALKILVYALKASVQELLMLSIFLIIGMLVFASMIYYAERQDASKSQNSKFTTIPMGFWWAIITMTTVGYGDVYPTTVIGYFVGTGCAVAGVLLLALTIPVISNNFTLFYSHVRSRKDVSKTTSISEVYKRDDENDQLTRAKKNSTESVTIDNFTPRLSLPETQLQVSNKDMHPKRSFSGTQSMMDIVMTSRNKEIDLPRSSSMHLTTHYNGKNKESMI